MEFDFSKKRHPRDAYGETLVKLGKIDPDMVVLDADLSCSTKTYLFGKEYPDRFFNVGIQEQNLMGFSAGFAIDGRTVFTSCFAMFGAGRAWEQIRNTIAYDNLNVKIVLTHAGITVGKDGASHQINEDIALMRSIPGMTIIVPCDYNSTQKVVEHIAKEEGPHYVRLSREKYVDIYPDDFEFDFNVPNTLIEGTDVTILSYGFMIHKAIQAANELKEEGVSVRVVDVQKIKPLNEEFIIKCASETGALVTCEEHSIIGGLGSAVAEVISENNPTILERIGVKDRFGASGNAKELLEEYELTEEDIKKAVRKAIERKG